MSVPNKCLVSTVAEPDVSLTRTDACLDIPMGRISTAEATNYGCIYDMLMKKVEASLETQCKCNRITGTKYADAYIAAQGYVIQGTNNMFMNMSSTKSNIFSAKDGAIGNVYDNCIKRHAVCASEIAYMSAQSEEVGIREDNILKDCNTALTGCNIILKTQENTTALCNISLLTNTIIGSSCDNTMKGKYIIKETCNNAILTQSVIQASCNTSILGCNIIESSCNIKFIGSKDLNLKEDTCIKTCTIALAGCDIVIKGCETSIKTCDIALKGCDITMATCQITEVGSNIGLINEQIQGFYRDAAYKQYKSDTEMVSMLATAGVINSCNTNCSTDPYQKLISHINIMSEIMLSDDPKTVDKTIDAQLVKDI